jgi:DNA-binding PadR family transcriptional regulator
MPRRPFVSSQTSAVLAAFVSNPATWRYGLSLSKELQLASGTLYPLLARLAEHGLLESDWLPPEKPGRPARHVYRLTPAGLAFARERSKESGIPFGVSTTKALV